MTLDEAKFKFKRGRVLWVQIDRNVEAQFCIVKVRACGSKASPGCGEPVLECNSPSGDKSVLVNPESRGANYELHECVKP